MIHTQVFFSPAAEEKISEEEKKHIFCLYDFHLMIQVSQSVHIFGGRGEEGSDKEMLV